MRPNRNPGCDHSTNPTSCGNNRTYSRTYDGTHRGAYSSSID
jgi:hypothetical protein